jgi:TPR repeat protein
MFRRLLPVALTILLAANTVAHAEDPAKSPALPGADAFERGWKYDQAVGVPMDMQAAIRAYRTAVVEGSVMARGRLAMIYASGNGVPVDKREAERQAKGIFPDLLKIAENNNAVAQLIVSYMYYDGLGVARDGDEGTKWMFKAAALNLPLAMADIGVSYEHGIGVAKDQASAVRWYRKAAVLGSPMAQAYLGDMLRKGQGVAQDDVEAVKWYRLSAAQNFAHGETNLGYMFEHGCVVEQNTFEAVRLYRLAANQNFNVGEYNLGSMYENGCGVPQDLAEAVRWYRKAAAQDYAPAIEKLRCLGYDE